MTKWEYRIVRTEGEIVLWVDGEHAGYKSTLLGVKGTKIWEYLNEAGLEGWKVITVHADDYPVYVLERKIG